MKVKSQQMTPVDAMQMMADPSSWGYYNPDLWDLSDPHSPDSDSDHEEEDGSPPMMPGYQGGTPADIAMAMSGMPGYGFETVGPLTTSEKDVLNELVQELGIVTSQTPGVLPPVTQPQPAVVGHKPAGQLAVAPVNLTVQNQVQVPEASSSKPSVVLSVKHSTPESKARTTKPKPIKRERAPTPDLEDILAKPVKSHKAVDVDAVVERNRKNAIQARINRQKKKQQVDVLEDRIAELEEDKTALELRCIAHEQEKATLRQEVVYLRSVLANQSALAGLLKNVNHTDGAVLRSSPADRKRVSPNGDSALQQKKSKTDVHVAGSTAGVCLHVDSDVVSLEFCEKCAQMAKGTAALANSTSTSSQ